MLSIQIFSIVVSEIETCFKYKIWFMLFTIFLYDEPTYKNKTDWNRM